MERAAGTTAFYINLVPTFGPPIDVTGGTGSTVPMSEPVGVVSSGVVSDNEPEEESLRRIRLTRIELLARRFARKRVARDLSLEEAARLELATAQLRAAIYAGIEERLAAYDTLIAASDSRRTEADKILEELGL